MKIGDHAMEFGPSGNVVGIGRDPFIRVPSDDVPTTAVAVRLNALTLLWQAVSIGVRLLIARDPNVGYGGSDGVD
jgi:hypothetical protein